MFNRDKLNVKGQAEEICNWLCDYAQHRINSQLIDERRSIPPNIILDFGNKGLLGLQAPLRYGGLELNNQDTLKIIQQLGAIDPTLATFVGVQNFLGIRPLINYASQKTQEDNISLLATGRKLAAFALTEPGAGSNPLAISASAVPEGQNSWRLKGTKIWSGSAAWASILNVFVQTFDDRGQYIGMSGFTVPQETLGLKQGPEALTMGLRGMVQNTVYLDNILVSSEDLLGKVGDGMKVSQDSMTFGRLCIAALSIGGMKRCTQLILRYASRRSVSTGVLFKNPVTLTKLSKITFAITAIEALVGCIAEQLDRGCSIPVDIYAVCKITAPEYFCQAADYLVQLLGGRGYIETNMAPQILRDARILRIYEGPTETLSMFLGSRGSSGNSELYQFVEEDLKAPKSAAMIREAVDKLKSCYDNMQLSFSKPNIKTQWMNYRLGEIIALGVLVGAVEGELQNFNSVHLHKAFTWLNLNFEYTLRNYVLCSSSESIMFQPDNLMNQIEDYTADIGDIEQTLPGEDYQTDVLLCKKS